ncbi:putative Phytocyanin domain, cupredoxin [Helianthus annuus]|nr:putative Phytocyanin domain, cupredoxin [Helianthus annuus]
MTPFNFNMLMFMAMLVAPMALATQHVVGDNDGWSNPRYPEFYAEWASLHTFNVGDTLFFNFTKEAHDVAEVPQEAYDQCHTQGAKVIIKSAGAVKLTSCGAHHYISTRKGDCETHQKVALYVQPSSV